MGQNTRTSATTGTIPDYTALSGGTVTTDANKTSTLIYTGTDVLTTTAFPLTHCGAEGLAWVYVASATPKLARVLGVVEVDLTNPAALVYALILDRAMPSVSGATANYIRGDLKSYSISNQGGADGVYDGNTISDGTNIAQAIQWPFVPNVLEAKTFDASGTSFLILENK